MRLILVRHGQSKGNIKAGFISGRSDKEGLTVWGRSQILRTAYELKQSKASAVLSSPVARAMESAAIIAEVIHCPSKEGDWLTELHHGRHEGRYWWEVTSDMGDKWQSMRTDITSSYPEGESFFDMYKRVKTGLKTLVGGKDDRTIILVSHQIIIATILFIMQYPDEEVSPGTRGAEHFMQFIHGMRVPNGLVATVLTHNLRLDSLSFASPKKNSAVQPETVSEYIRIHLGQVPKKVVRKETLSLNDVYEVEGNERMLFKVLHDKETVRSSRLVALYDYLKRVGVPAPRVVHYDNSKEFFPDTVLVQDFQQGSDMCSCIIADTLPKSTLFTELNSSLKKIHTIPVSEVHDFWYPDDWSTHTKTAWGYYMTTEIDKTIHSLSHIKPNGYARKTLQMLREHIINSKIPLVPLHGDLGPGNIIAEDDRGCRLQRIIDFERARLGEAMWDFAYLYGSLELISKQAAMLWKDTFFKDLTHEEKKLFLAYRVLYLAWTVRDMIDYEGNEERTKEGKKALALLETYMSS